MKRSLAQQWIQTDITFKCLMVCMENAVVMGKLRPLGTMNIQKGQVYIGGDQLLLPAMHGQDIER